LIDYSVLCNDLINQSYALVFFLLPLLLLLLLLNYIIIILIIFWGVFVGLLLGFQSDIYIFMSTQIHGVCNDEMDRKCYFAIDSPVIGVI